MWSCTFPWTVQMNLSLFSVKKTTQELSIQVTSSVLLPSKLQACTWAFCNGIPLALSMRHRFTVAGNYESLFLFFCFFSPWFFCNKTVTWSVPENQHRELSGIWREKHCYYTINCISFWGTKGLFMTDSNLGSFLNQNLKVTFEN